jgi:hypothetical protein
MYTGTIISQMSGFTMSNALQSEIVLLAISSGGTPCLIQPMIIDPAVSHNAQVMMSLVCPRLP